MNWAPLLIWILFCLLCQSVMGYRTVRNLDFSTSMNLAVGATRSYKHETHYDGGYPKCADSISLKRAMAFLITEQPLNISLLSNTPGKHWALIFMFENYRGAAHAKISRGINSFQRQIMSESNVSG